MRSLLTPAVALLVVLAVAPASSGCGSHRRHSHSGGPVERAGASVDHALDKTGDAIENTGDKVDRALPGN